MLGSPEHTVGLPRLSEPITESSLSKPYERLYLEWDYS